ncbi:MAG: AAA family ATPase [bacterium]|nr:AAA family ATPase [bacterium]
MENKNLKLEVALDYQSKGFSIIPVGADKKPLIAWGAYQQRKASSKEIEEWFKNYPNMNIGIVTGKISGIVVVDIEKGGNSDGYLPTVTAKSGGGGIHLYYKHPGYEVPNGARVRALTDIRGDGGYVLAPPSISDKGTYEWTTSLNDSAFSQMPEWITKAKLSKENDKKWLSGKDGASEGSRNDTAASIAGKIISSTAPELLESIGWEQFKVWNTKNIPPLSETELRGVWESIKKYHADEREPEANWTPTNRPRLWTIGEILTHDFGEEEWLVESLIPKQGLTALSGNPGDFKTWVTIHIALCISRSLPVFGTFKTTQGSVLIIDEEDHLRLLKKRLGLLGAKEADNIYYLSQNGIKVDIESVRNMILEIVKEKNIKLVILDSLVRVHQQEENDAGGMAKVFSGLQKIITAGASILFTHHHRKQNWQKANNPGQNMRGSSDILAAVDCHITIEKKNEEEDRLILRQTKLRQGELLPPFEISITQGALGPSGFEYAGGHDEKKKKTEEVAEAMKLLLAEGMKNRPEILELLGDDYGRDVIDGGIKLAEETGDIERVPKKELPKGERKTHYQIPGTSSNPINTDNDESNELPAFQPYIGAGKQEDIKTESYAK